jgi:hypothetical protein
MARAKVLVRGVVLGLFASVLVALLAQPAQARDNTGTICQQTASTLQTGQEAMLGQLSQASSQLTSGDAAGAKATVKQIGASLSTLAHQVRQQNNADNPQLKNLIDQLAAQVDAVSAQLANVNDLAELDHLDSGPLDSLMNQFIAICGPDAFPAPAQSAAPTQTS